MAAPERERRSLLAVSLAAVAAYLLGQAEARDHQQKRCPALHIRAHPAALLSCQACECLVQTDTCDLLRLQLRLHRTHHKGYMTTIHCPVQCSGTPC